MRSFFFLLSLLVPTGLHPPAGLTYIYPYGD
jgi:hypothetical protein